MNHPAITGPQMAANKNVKSCRQKHCVGVKSSAPYFLMIMWLFFGISGLAQNSTAFNAAKVMSPSPDAASFSKYGEVPVSLYTGVPQIEIPLYTIKSKDIVIPITLSYHAGGVKVEEESGWTGLGWNLNVGGVITRQVRGGNDLAVLNDGFHGTYWVNNHQYQGYPYDGAIPNPMTQSYLANVCQNIVDPEPDVFFFNMPGKSGSFILEKGQTIGADLVGTPTTSQKINIKYDRTINKWVIKTIDGFTYQFGVREIQEIKRTPPPTIIAGQVMISTPVDEESSSYSTFTYFSTSDYNITAWYLEKIISPTNEQVTYLYDVETISGCGNGPLSKFGSRSVSFTDEYTDPISITVGGSDGTNCWGNLLASNRIRERSQTFTGHIYLKEIQFRNGSITFSKSDREDILSAKDVNNTPTTGLLGCSIGWGNSNAKGPQKLDSLTIKDENNVIRKKIKLEYSYFNPSNNASNKHLYKRLKLTKATDCSSIAGNCLPAYQIEYNESIPLPSKYSRALDFWGFYNGQTGNVSRVPGGTFAPNGYSTAKFIGDANRQPSEIYMTAGTISKIIYPTGGYTTFQFEPNDYSIYGTEAFGITNFESSMVNTVQLAYQNSYGGATTDLIQNFTLTQTTDLNIKSTLAYLPTVQNYSFPCCARNPFSGYDGNGNYIAGTNYNTAEPYLEIRNASSNALLYNLNLEQYALFLQTCTSPCNGSGNTGHGAFLNKEAPLSLPAGNYKLILKQKQYWQMNSTIESNSLKTKTIPLVNGVYAKMGGGLRIKNISSYNLSSKLEFTKNYNYTRSSGSTIFSSGRLMMFPANHTVEATDVSSNGNPGQCNGSVTTLIGRSYSKLPLGSGLLGNIVGYDQVTVTEDANGTNGKTISYFDNHEDVVVPGTEIFSGFPNVFYTTNGNLLKEEVYNGSGKLFKEVSNTYVKELAKDIPSLAFRKTFQGAMMHYNGMALDASCISYQANKYFTVPLYRYSLTNRVTKEFSLTTNDFITYTDKFTYNLNSHLQVSVSEKTTSKNEQWKEFYKYPSDFATAPYTEMVNRFIIAPVVLTDVYKDGIYIQSNRTNYNYWGNNQWGYVSAGSFMLPQTTEYVIGTGNPFITADRFTAYDVNGNPAVVGKDNDVLTTIIWDPTRNFALAKATNASLADVAFSSFESTYTGNWSYSGTVSSAVSPAVAATGAKYYNLTPATQVSKAVTSGKKYMISYWSNQGSAYTISGGTGTVTTGPSLSGWTLYSHAITASSSAVSISGTGNIDELRLIPADAQMVSFTIDSFNGITTATNESNQSMYYEYDAFGRLILVKDKSRNIVKKYDYNYFGQP